MKISTDNVKEIFFLDLDFRFRLISSVLKDNALHNNHFVLFFVFILIVSFLCSYFIVLLLLLIIRHSKLFSNH